MKERPNSQPGNEINLDAIPAHILPLHMYAIPGQESVTDHSMERYLQDKLQQSEIINAIDHTGEVFKERIHDARVEDRVPLLIAGLRDANREVRMTAVSIIFFAQAEDRSKVIREGFSINDSEVREHCAIMIPTVPLAERPDLISKALDIDDSAVQMNAVSAIPSLIRSLRLDLFKKAWATGNFNVQLRCLRYVEYLQPEQQEVLRKMALDTATTSLGNKGKKVQLEYAYMIDEVPPEDRVRLKKKILKLIEAGLAGNDPQMQLTYARMIVFAPQEETKRLFELAKAKLGNALVEPQLYAAKTVSDKNFSRTEFPKTDSATTLLGGKLKNRTIIRHFKPETFLVWQRVFENYAMWQKAGFDYVPIEPIQSFRLTKDKMVDVYSGVLDLSLDQWHKTSDKFYEEFKQETEKIIDVLNKNKTYHGHPHYGNFCLRFFRKENGDVDFDRKPRIYLIDFDQAIQE